MSVIGRSSLKVRLKRELPPSRSFPAIYQTLCCRWLPAAYLKQCHARLGSRFTVYAWDMPPLVFLTDPNDIRAVLTGDPDRLHPGAGAEIILPLVGDRSFMLLEGEEHICGRHAITPAFHQRMIADCTHLMSEMVDREVATWPLDTVLPLDHKIRSLTLKIILGAIFGDDDNAIIALHQQLMEMLSITVSIVFQEPKVRHLPGWGKAWRTFVKQRFEVDDQIYGLIHRRRSETRGGDLKDLLDMLLDAKTAEGSPMSDHEIRDNLMSMILAGHETTTGEITWAFQLMAHNLAVQARLVEEIDKGTGDQYLTATVHETLRHKPVFLFAIPREVVKPVEIGGWTYHPPAHLVGCTYLMHHNPELYPNPGQFHPERFLANTQQSRTWLPWGGGRKHCLG